MAIESINPLAALNAGNPQQTELDALQTEQSELSIDDFFQLLTTQLTSQDPLNPMDDTEFVSQMASFSTLSQMENMAADMKTLRQQQETSTIQTLLGKSVEVDLGDGETLAGTVSRIERVEGNLYPVVNGQRVELSQIIRISADPAASILPGQGIG
mgnify:CR=1 FL=1